MRRAIVIFVLILHVAAITVCSRDGRKVTTSDPEKALRPTLGEFERKGGAKAYDEDDLWKLIDGGAEVLIKKGIKKAAVADYARGKTEINVHIYAFASKDGAAWLYDQNRSPQDKSVHLGNGGSIGPGSLVFYKNRLFVQLSSFNQDIDIATLEQLGKAVDSILP